MVDWDVFLEVMLGAKLIRSELASIRLPTRRFLKKVIQKGSSQQLQEVLIHNQREVC